MARGLPPRVVLVVSVDRLMPEVWLPASAPCCPGVLHAAACDHRGVCAGRRLRCRRRDQRQVARARLRTTAVFRCEAHPAVRLLNWIYWLSMCLMHGAAQTGRDHHGHLQPRHGRPTHRLERPRLQPADARHVLPSRRHGVLPQRGSRRYVRVPLCVLNLGFSVLTPAHTSRTRAGLYCVGSATDD